MSRWSGERLTRYPIGFVRRASGEWEAVNPSSLTISPLRLFAKGSDESTRLTRADLVLDGGARSIWSPLPLPRRWHPTEMLELPEPLRAWPPGAFLRLQFEGQEPQALAVIAKRFGAS